MAIFLRKHPNELIFGPIIAPLSGYKEENEFGIRAPLFIRKLQKSLFAPKKIQAVKNKSEHVQEHFCTWAVEMGGK